MLHRTLIASTAGAAVVALVAPGPAQAQAARCRAADLAVRIGHTHAGAGQRWASLHVRNRTHSTCRTYGYVGLRLLDGRGNKLPTDVVRTRHDARREVELQPQDDAYTIVHWGAVAGAGESENGACEPTPARLEVTPPDGTRQLVTAWRDGPVCEQGRLEIEPLHDRPKLRTRASWPLVRRGERSNRVRVVQRLLDAHGRRLLVDGIYGPGTTGAVRTFQSGHHLRRDGVVGASTWKRLIDRVRRGDRGDAVLAAQRLLRAHGDYHGHLDGIFGPSTQHAVRSFQRGAGLHVDGNVGSRTWRELLSR